MKPLPCLPAAAESLLPLCQRLCCSVPVVACQGLPTSGLKDLQYNTIQYHTDEAGDTHIMHEFIHDLPDSLTFYLPEK